MPQQSYFAGKAKISKDDYETPLWVWEQIIGLVNNKNLHVWCPFYCNGLVSQHLASLGQSHTHENKDFFTWEPPAWDCIIDNPPYSIKQRVFEKCFELGKPFALFVPLDTLERRYIKKIFGSSPDLQVIIPSKRTDFITDYETKHTCPPHMTIWVCYKMHLCNGQQLIYL